MRKTFRLFLSLTPLLMTPYLISCGQAGERPDPEQSDAESRPKDETIPKDRAIPHVKPDTGESGDAERESTRNDEGGTTSGGQTPAHWLMAGDPGGVTTGNGGDGFRCPGPGGKDFVILNDVYEAKHRWQLNVHYDDTGVDLKERVINTLKRLAAMDRMLSFKLTLMAETFFERDVVKYTRGVSLMGIDDANLLGGPKDWDCTPVRVARQAPPATYLDRYYNIDLDLFDLMDNDNKVALVIHEIIYRLFIEDHGHQDSTQARFLNALIGADALASMPRVQYFNVLMNIGRGYDAVANLRLPLRKIESTGKFLNTFSAVTKATQLFVPQKFTKNSVGNRQHLTARLPEQKVYTDIRMPYLLKLDYEPKASASGVPGLEPVPHCPDCILSVGGNLIPREVTQGGGGPVWLTPDGFLGKIQLFHVSDQEGRFTQPVPKMTIEPLTDGKPRQVRIDQKSPGLAYEFVPVGEPVNSPSRFGLSGLSQVFFGRGSKIPHAILNPNDDEFHSAADGKLMVKFGWDSVFFGESGKVQLYPETKTGFWQLHGLDSSPDFVTAWEQPVKIRDELTDFSRPQRLTVSVPKDLDFNLVEQVTAKVKMKKGHESIQSFNRSLEFTPVQSKNTLQLNALERESWAIQEIDFRLLNGFVRKTVDISFGDAERVELDSAIGVMKSVKIILAKELFLGGRMISLDLSYKETGDSHEIMQYGGWKQAYSTTGEDVEIEWRHLQADGDGRIGLSLRFFNEKGTQVGKSQTLGMTATNAASHAIEVGPGTVQIPVSDGE